MNFSDYSTFLKYINCISSIENSLNPDEFDTFVSSLFTGYDEKLGSSKLAFSVLDKNSDCKLDSKELEVFWYKLVKPLIKPVTALIIIDVQNDFIGGSLALKNCPAKQDGKNVIPVINSLLETLEFDIVVYTRDYHPGNHISFYDNINLHKGSFQDYTSVSEFDKLLMEDGTEQVLWPRHCVQHTWGSKLHEDLTVKENSFIIKKGLNPEIDSYSAVFDNKKNSETGLQEELRKHNVSHVFICGLALDYCVAATATDIVDLGYATVIIEDATAGTDVVSIKAVKEKLIKKNCVFCKSPEVENLITGKCMKTEFLDVLINNI